MAGVEILWAPWRMAYVGAGTPVSGCLFCAVRSAADDRTHRVLVRGSASFLMLNAYPYSTGHLMTVNARHVESLEELDDTEQLELLGLTRRALRALRAEYRPDGFNVGANLGRAAGAGVAGHLHLHVVPRWSGDTNFMPVVGAVKVIPEDLDATYHRLLPHFVA